MFRAATAADIPAIAAMWHAGWHDGHAAYAPSALTVQRTPDSFTIRTTAHLSQTIVNGDITAMAMITGDELYQFYVAAAARGTGLATALMAHAEDQFRLRGITRPWLACSEGNTRAARFYAKMGWENCGLVNLAVETLGSPFTVPVWRFEKTLA